MKVFWAETWHYGYGSMTIIVVAKDINEAFELIKPNVEGYEGFSIDDINEISTNVEKGYIAAHNGYYE